MATTLTSKHDARVASSDGHIWWRCPNCDQKLAEIMNARVVIRIGDRLISLPSNVEQDQVCWRCGTMSNLGKDSYLGK